MTHINYTRIDFDHPRWVCTCHRQTYMMSRLILTTLIRFVGEATSPMNLPIFPVVMQLVESGRILFMESDRIPIHTLHTIWIQEHTAHLILRMSINQRGVTFIWY
jgi:hypothetical protein